MRYDFITDLVAFKVALRLTFRCPEDCPKVFILRVEYLIVYLRFGLAVVWLPCSIIDPFFLSDFEEFLFGPSMLYRLIKFLSFLLIGNCNLVCFSLNVLVCQIRFADLVEKLVFFHEFVYFTVLGNHCLRLDCTSIDESWLSEFPFPEEISNSS